VRAITTSCTKCDRSAAGWTNQAGALPTASELAKVGLGLRFNVHLEGDGPTIFAHACKMGLEGIVSKRKDSMYRSGRSPDWLKMKNPTAPAVKREEDEEWGKKKQR
jgi:ATP-dependent DNA ligase